MLHTCWGTCRRQSGDKRQRWGVWGWAEVFFKCWVLLILHLNKFQIRAQDWDDGRVVNRHSCGRGNEMELKWRERERRRQWVRVGRSHFLWSHRLLTQALIFCLWCTTSPKRALGLFHVSPVTGQADKAPGRKINSKNKVSIAVFEGTHPIPVRLCGPSACQGV